jgi:ferrous iron transport protein B
VILALVGYYLGPLWAFALYIFNIALIAATGKVMSSMLPQLTPGMILEVPRYQLPAMRSLLHKTWFRMREFVSVAWPLLIAGSILLSLAQYYGITGILNAGLSPLTSSILGLPAATGSTLIFGVLRKELSLVMLIQALGTPQMDTVMTPQQMLTFTVFVMFYIPCIATIAILARETGKKVALYASGFTFALATLAGVIVRFTSSLLLS